MLGTWRYVRTSMSRSPSRLGPPCHALRVQLGELQPMTGVKGTKGLHLHRLLVQHKPVAALASTAVFVDDSGRCAPWAVFIDELRNFCL